MVDHMNDVIVTVSVLLYEHCRVVSVSVRSDKCCHLGNMKEVRLKDACCHEKTVGVGAKKGCMSPYSTMKFD